MGFTPVNPPNAALVADTAQQDDDVLLLELLNPTYDAASQTLTYEADILQQYRGEGLKPLAAQQRDKTIAPTFGSASLFIDDCPDANFDCCISGATSCGPGNAYYAGHLGTFGACWSWSDGCCVPCVNPSHEYWEAQCNQTFPACNGSCVALTDWVCQE
jgi:hypothetical protein